MRRTTRKGFSACQQSDEFSLDWQQKNLRQTSPSDKTDMDRLAKLTNGIKLNTNCLEIQIIHGLCYNGRLSLKVNYSLF